MRSPPSRESARIDRARHRKQNTTNPACARIAKSGVERRDRRRADRARQHAADRPAPPSPGTPHDGDVSTAHPGGRDLPKPSLARPWTRDSRRVILPVTVGGGASTKATYREHPWTARRCSTKARLSRAGASDGSTPGRGTIQAFPPRSARGAAHPPRRPAPPRGARPGHPRSRPGRCGSPCR